MDGGHRNLSRSNEALSWGDDLATNRPLTRKYGPPIAMEVSGRLISTSCSGFRSSGARSTSREIVISSGEVVVRVQSSNGTRDWVAV